MSTVRAMLAELKLGPQDWVSVLLAIATSLNESGLERLGRGKDGTASRPLEDMTGISPKRQVLRVLPPGSHARATQVLKID